MEMDESFQTCRHWSRTTSETPSPGNQLSNQHGNQLRPIYSTTRHPFMRESKSCRHSSPSGAIVEKAAAPNAWEASGLKDGVIRLTSALCNGPVSIKWMLPFLISVKCRKTWIPDITRSRFCRDVCKAERQTYVEMKTSFFSLCEKLWSRFLFSCFHFPNKKLRGIRYVTHLLFPHVLFRAWHWW